MKQKDHCQRQNQKQKHKSKKHHKYEHKNKHKKRQRNKSQSQQSSSISNNQNRKSRNKHYLSSKKQHTISYNYQQYQKKQQHQRQSYIQQQQKIEKQLPCFQPSGILLQYYNSRQGVKLKFTQPQDSIKPIQQWRIYPFKGQQSLNPILLKESCYLIGKDERICDILCQNPSISRQHAVIQFRLIHKMMIDGSYQQIINCYVMDLQSTNGTFLNDQKIQSIRYVQLLDRDILKFGLSDRQYVIVKQQKQNDQQKQI